MSTDEQELRRAFRAAFDASRPTAGAADRAFARVADDEVRAHGTGRRLAGAAAVALALLVVATLFLARGGLTLQHASAPASQPVAPPAQAPTWNGLAPGPPNQPPPSLAAALSDRVVLAGWSGGGQVELTTDGGTTWTALHVPAGALFDVQWVGNDTALVSTDAGLYRFQRSTSGWARLTPRGDLVRLDFTDATSGFAVTARGDVVETEDGGQTLTTRDVGIRPVTWLQWVSSSRAWVAGPQGIAATRDGGATWSRQLSFPAPAAPGSPGAPLGQITRAQVGFRDEANGFAVFDFVRGPTVGFVVYHTADSGATWTPEGCTCAGGAPPDWLRGSAAAALPWAPQHSDLVVTGPSSATLLTNDAPMGMAHICTTGDSGRDWSCGPAPYQGGGPAALAVRGQSWWLVGRVGQSGVLLASSPDAGVTWTVQRP
ncbi:MAG TPA: hypothetical protein VE953_08365 [Terriglobales bacterium]|nr:hypothetical protein [Terriglobales bacterium]